MKLPDFRPLTRETFADVEEDWPEPLLKSVNTFQEQVFNGLNKQITLSDNIQSRVVELTFTTASDYTTNDTFQPLNIALTFKATAVFIAQLIAPNNAIITTAFTPCWYFTNSGISVKFISGLADSTKYTARFLVL